MDPLRSLLENAPDDDEPFDPKDLEGVDDEPPMPHEGIFARADEREGARHN